MSSKYEILVLTREQQASIEDKGETSMGGYQTGRVYLVNGQKYRVEIDQWKYIFYVEGYDYVPFSEQDIKKIRITHEEIDNTRYNQRRETILELGLRREGKFLVERSVPRDEEMRPESPSSDQDVTKPRPSFWPVILVVFAIGVALAIILPAPETDVNYATGGRSKVSRVKTDLRSIATALETYYLDNNEYPSWAMGAEGANAGLPPESPSYRIPTFRLKRNRDDPIMTLTTPVAYITSYFADPFARDRDRYINATFAYWVAPKNVIPWWILWSPGPDGVYDIIPERDFRHLIRASSTPTTATMNAIFDTLALKTYDSTNGSPSAGDIIRLKQ